MQVFVYTPDIPLFINVELEFIFDRKQRLTQKSNHKVQLGAFRHDLKGLGTTGNLNYSMLYFGDNEVRPVKTCIRNMKKNSFVKTHFS